MRTGEVMIFVRRGAEYLVLLRSERQGGYWHPVSGGIEPGESSAAAAARELLEETGLDASPVGLGRSFVYQAEPWEPHYEEGMAPIRVDCYVVDAPDGWEPQLDWEHDEHRWCSPAEAAAILYWPEPREVIRELGA
jgi:8-oxo-dGTP pyrophosphatase MutT (NUDIX family)